MTKHDVIDYIVNFSYQLQTKKTFGINEKNSYVMKDFLHYN
jgi:hypothetical protein